MRRIVRSFIIRMAVIFLIAGLVSSLVVEFRRVPGISGFMIPIVAAFGVSLPFWRGLDRLIRHVRQIGRDRLNQRRFADARFVLDYFHRLGTMNLDIEGESHFYLVQALIGLGELDRAAQITAWLQKYRRRWQWPEKARAALEIAQRAQARREVAQEAAADSATPLTEEANSP